MSLKLFHCLLLTSALVTTCANAANVVPIDELSDEMQMMLGTKSIKNDRYRDLTEVKRDAVEFYILFQTPFLQNIQLLRNNSRADDAVAGIDYKALTRTLKIKEANPSWSREDVIQELLLTSRMREDQLSQANANQLYAARAILDLGYDFAKLGSVFEHFSKEASDCEAFLNKLPPSRRFTTNTVINNEITDDDWGFCGWYLLTQPKSHDYPEQRFKKYFDTEFAELQNYRLLIKNIYSAYQEALFLTTAESIKWKKTYGSPEEDGFCLLVDFDRSGKPVSFKFDDRISKDKSEPGYLTKNDYARFAQNLAGLEHLPSLEVLSDYATQRYFQPFLMHWKGTTYEADVRNPCAPFKNNPSIKIR